MIRTTSRTCLLLLGSLLLGILFCDFVFAAKRGPANVPPHLEIEVLDPNADPLGRPAVELLPTMNGLEVDIPPVILVHRYYYTGDRSFQAQLLPGGPTIIVATHPKTGERCYIEAQLMPGAPRVTYTSNSIQFDYGKHAAKIHFGMFGKPKVKYRSGYTLLGRVGKVVKADQWQEKAQEHSETWQNTSERVHNVSLGAVATVTDTTKQYVVTPVQNMLQTLPFGKVIFNSDWEQRLTERAAQFKRDKGVKKAQNQFKRDDFSINTLR